jgi:hypothetical protein
VKLVGVVGLDRTGMVVHSNGRVSRVLSLTRPNVLLVGESGVRRMAGGMEQIVNSIESTVGLQAYVDGLGDSTGTHRADEPGETAYLVWSDRTRRGIDCARALRLGGSRRLGCDLYAAAQTSWEQVVALAEQLRSIDCEATVLDGAQVWGLLARRLVPGGAMPLPRPLEVLGTLDPAGDAVAAMRTAGELNECIRRVVTVEVSQVRIGEDVEHVSFVAGLLDPRLAEWSELVRNADVPFALSVQLTPAAPTRGVRGTPAGSERHELSSYLTLRSSERGTDSEQLVAAWRVVSTGITQVGRAPLHRGDFRQAPLWASSLPLGRDEARLAHPCPANRVVPAMPLMRATCGSPGGFAVGRAPGGATERLDPWAEEHRTTGVLIVGAGADAERLVGVLTRQLSVGGIRAASVDRDPVSDADPWEVDAASAPDPAKRWYVAALHEQILGDLLTLDAGHHHVLEDGIARVFDRALEEQRPAREGDLIRELEVVSGPVSDRAHDLAFGVRNLAIKPGYRQLLGGVGSEAPSATAVQATETPELRSLRRWTLAEQNVRQLAAANHQGACRGGALLIWEADSLLAGEQSARWLELTIHRARRLGLFVIAVVRDWDALASSRASRCARACPIKLFTTAPPQQDQALLHGIGLTTRDEDVLARLAENEAHPGRVYCVNGRRGGGMVALAEAG